MRTGPFQIIPKHELINGKWEEFIWETSWGLAIFKVDNIDHKPHWLKNWEPETKKGKKGKLLPF